MKEILIGLDKFLSGIDWSSVKRIHTPNNGNLALFSVEVGKTRNTIAVVTGPSTIAITVSDSKGHILVHAIQQTGQKMKFYATKPDVFSSFAHGLDSSGPVNLTRVVEAAGSGEPGV